LIEAFFMIVIADVLYDNAASGKVAGVADA
jgi:hypothetical protein